jgi:hypothetical protein
LGIWGLSGLDRSDRCVAPAWPVWSHLVEVAKFNQQGPVWQVVPPVWPVLVSGLWCFAAFSGRKVVCWFLGPVALQWATWAWPTWVVSRRRVGSRVHLVGVSISFEKNFYRLRFTPPLSSSPYRSFMIQTKKLHKQTKVSFMIQTKKLHKQTKVMVLQLY